MRRAGVPAGDRVLVFGGGPIGTLIALVGDWTDGPGVDIAFEVTGNPAAARAVTDVVRVWGTDAHVRRPRPTQSIESLSTRTRRTWM